MCKTQDIYNAYKKFITDNGLPFTLKKEKLGQVISKVHGKILIKVCVIDGVKHNFYQDFRLIRESKRGPSNPVVFVPAHILTCFEHEIMSYMIKTMYIRDGKDMDFTFCISSETGLFDLYFGDEEIDNMEVFAIHLQTEHNQFFVDGIHRLADALRPCMGVGPTHINFSKKTLGNYCWTKYQTQVHLLSFTSMFWITSNVATK